MQEGGPGPPDGKLPRAADPVRPACGCPRLRRAIRSLCRHPAGTARTRLPGAGAPCRKPMRAGTRLRRSRQSLFAANCSGTGSGPGGFAGFGPALRAAGTPSPCCADAPTACLHPRPFPRGKTGGSGQVTGRRQTRHRSDRPDGPAAPPNQFSSPPRPFQLLPGVLIASAHRCRSRDTCIPPFPVQPGQALIASARHSRGVRSDAARFRRFAAAPPVAGWAGPETSIRRKKRRFAARAAPPTASRAAPHLSQSPAGRAPHLQS